MKKIIFLILVIFSSNGAFAQDAACTHAEFDFQGKTYVANYDEAKHVLTMNEEVSFEIFDETGTCIRRSEGLTVDFKSILKTGVEKTYTIRFYKKTKASKKKKNASIKQKGEIGVMVIKDQK